MNHRCRLGNDKPASAESKRTSGLLQPVVCCLLQRVENSSVSWQRRSNPSCHPARRPHRIGAGRRGPSPPLLSNLVFGTDRRLENLGSPVLMMSPAEFRKLIADETERWAKVIKFAK